MPEALGSRLEVTSHVGRDLLQSAALFKTEKAVVWEYVSNGLQYAEPGVSPIIRVRLDERARRVTIADNGRGMSAADLSRFFQMHGENLDRRHGRPGRGKWGTGKSAAFGIADLLRVTTVRSGLRCRVELTRDAVKASDGRSVPVREVERSVPTTEPDGTVVEIERINLRRLDQRDVIRFIQKQLAHWDRSARVYVNNHECEYIEPPFTAEHTFEPPVNLVKVLGDVRLLVRVSKAPLDEETRGISVYANGVWHAQTLAGSEGREMSQYIFGEIDVPALDRDDDPIPAFDMSRSMVLNPSNAVVQAIYQFVGPCVEQIRRGLADAEKERKATEEARRLAAQASEIARVINEDFAEYADRLARARARGGSGEDAHRGEASGGSDASELARGGDHPARVTATTGAPGTSGGEGGSPGSPPRRLQPVVTPDPDGAERGHPAGGEGTRHRVRGGFTVDFQHHGGQNPRAVYMRDQRAIIINLDHPQIEAARGGREADDPVFKRLAYEVAFTEYAIALASERAGADEFLDPIDAITDMRDTLNRVAARGATLYRAGA